MKKLLPIIAALLVALSASAVRYAGGDISLLPEYQKAGAQYKTHDGTPITTLLPWLRDQGMNAMRVRLFVDPAAYTGSDKDPNACQSLDYILPLCREINDAGLALMLDFHYSDSWADPAKQYTPAAWSGLNDEQLVAKINEYTKDVLTRLKAEGIVPAFIQTGNEISYGMLWGPVGTPDNQLHKTLMGSDANWNRLGSLLKSAIAACREVCPDAKIIIHTERVAQINVTDNFYDKMKSLGVDYDIIGLSYYPYFHGPMNVLKNTLDNLSGRYPDKNIMIVETGYSYKWEVPGTTIDNTGKYPYSDEGQNLFMKDLVDLCESYTAVNGIFWWWMEYNAFGTSLSGWYNAPLFDSLTGRATAALTTLASFADGDNGISLPTVTPTADDTWYDLSGRPVARPAQGQLYIHNHRVIKY